MASEKGTVPKERIESVQHSDHQHGAEFEAPMQHTAELSQAEHINLTWKTWIVVFVSCFAIMAQVFVVVAAGSVIAFIIRDLGEASTAGWIIRTYTPQTDRELVH